MLLGKLFKYFALLFLSLFYYKTELNIFFLLYYQKIINFCFYIYFTKMFPGVTILEFYRLVT